MRIVVASLRPPREARKRKTGASISATARRLGCRRSWSATPRLTVSGRALPKKRTAVVAVRRIGHRHAVRVEERAEVVHRLAARKLERVVVEADVALAVPAFASLRIGLRDPEQRLAVAPAREDAAVVPEVEAEEAAHHAVERLRAGEIAHAKHQMIDADDTGHGRLQCKTRY